MAVISDLELASLICFERKSRTVPEPNFVSEVNSRCCNNKYICKCLVLAVIVLT